MLLQDENISSIAMVRGQDSAVSGLTPSHGGSLRNCGLIPGWNKRSVSSPNWGLSSIPFNG